MPVIELNSLMEPGVEVFATLTEAQLRNRVEPDKGIFIAESPKVIRVALDAGYEPLSLLCEQKHITGDAADIIARCGDIPVYTGSRELLASLTGYVLTRGVLCAMRRPMPRPVDRKDRKSGSAGWWSLTMWWTRPISVPFSVRRLPWASMRCCSPAIRATRSTGGRCVCRWGRSSWCLGRGWTDR